MMPPLLTLIVLLPLAAALLSSLLPARLARGLALAAMLLVLLLSSLVLFSFEPAGPRFQFVERWPWIAGLETEQDR